MTPKEIERALEQAPNVTLNPWQATLAILALSHALAREPPNDAQSAEMGRFARHLARKLGRRDRRLRSWLLGLPVAPRWRENSEAGPS